MRPLTRAGVPVLKRASWNPSRSSARLIPEVAFSPARPPATVCFAAVKQAAHEGARRQDDGPGTVLGIALDTDADDPSGAALPLDQQVDNGLLAEGEVLLEFDERV